MGWIIKLMVVISVLLSVGTASAEAQMGSITVYLEDTQGILAIYQTDDYTEDDPDELASLIKSRNIQGKTKPIAADTPTVFADLPQGRYLVTHQEDAFRPFFVTVPTAINGTTSFAVEAWPKTQDLQTPQTGDPIKVYPLLAVLFLSLLGAGVMAAIKLTEKRF